MRAQLEALIDRWRVEATDAMKHESLSAVQRQAVRHSLVACADDLAVILAASPAETGWQPLDDERWKLICQAVNTSELNNFQKVVAIGSILNSREPHAEADILRARDLFPTEPAREGA